MISEVELPPYVALVLHIVLGLHKHYKNKCRNSDLMLVIDISLS